MGVPEWLSGMTRNHVGSARAGSNPAAHAFSFCVASTLNVKLLKKLSTQYFWFQKISKKEKIIFIFIFMFNYIIKYIYIIKMK